MRPALSSCIGMRGLRVWIAIIATLGLAACAGRATLAASSAASSTPSPTAAESPSPSPSPSAPSPTPVVVPVCKVNGMVISLYRQDAAAGNRFAEFRLQNALSTACTSFGYPDWDFHGSNGWLGVHAMHGTSYFGSLGTPRHLTVEPGQSLYLKAAWFVCGVYTCTAFDRVKISLPGTRTFPD